MIPVALCGTKSQRCQSIRAQQQTHNNSLQKASLGPVSPSVKRAAIQLQNDFSLLCSSRLPGMERGSGSAVRLVQRGPCEHDSCGEVAAMRMQGVFPRGLHRKRGKGGRTPNVFLSSSTMEEGQS